MKLLREILNKTLYRLVLLGFFCVLPAELFSRNYSVGYNKYLAGDFSGAEKDFQSALAGTSSSFEQSRIYKMLGISQYMQGKRILAEESFKQAKRINPSIRVTVDEVLDESIVDFFRNIRISKVKREEDKADEPRRDRRKDGTFIRVIANVRHARVTVDGKTTGKPGALIRVSQGRHEVEVYARGYNSISLPIEVLSGQVNDVTINLQKSSTKILTDSSRDKDQSISKGKKIKKKKARKKKKRRKKVRKKKKLLTSRSVSYPSRRPSPIVDFLPLGISHYLRGDYVSGSVYALAQLGGLTFYGVKFAEENSIVDESDQLIKARDIEQATLPTRAEQEAFYEETKKLYQEKKDQADQVSVEGYAGLTVFATFWLGSIVHSYINRGKPKSRSSHLEIEPGALPSAFPLKSGDRAVVAHHVHEPRWSLSPRIYPRRGGALPSLLLDFRLDF